MNRARATVLIVAGDGRGQSGGAAASSSSKERVEEGIGDDNNELSSARHFEVVEEGEERVEVESSSTDEA